MRKTEVALGGASFALSVCMHARIVAVVLTLGTAGCFVLPFEPDEPDEPDPVDNSGPPYPWQCADQTPTFAQGDAWNCQAFDGVSKTPAPGQLAPLQLVVSLGPEATTSLVDVELQIKARSGQALAGALLEATLGTQVLQTASLGGPLNQEANFRLHLGPSQCPDSCVVDVRATAPMIGSPLPVPLELSGLALITVHSGQAGYAILRQMRVEVRDAL